MTVLANTEIPERTVYVVPIRSGVGARLGINVGYLKFTPQPDLEPVLSRLDGRAVGRVPELLHIDRI